MSTSVGKKQGGGCGRRKRAYWRGSGIEEVEDKKESRKLGKRGEGQTEQGMVKGRRMVMLKGAWGCMVLVGLDCAAF
jgi:hypothetical protein